MRLLLVEDDAVLAATLTRGLREQQCHVDHAADGEGALLLARRDRYDAIILDLNIPKIDGLAVCRRLRDEGSTVRILMLTARSRMHDRVEGLDAGADSYLPKPFEFDELLARLRALMRRPGHQVETSHLTIADLEIDVPAQRVSRAGAPIPLTTKEFTLLEYLARKAGAVVGRAELTEHVWDDNHDPASHAVEVYIGRLRGKIDRAGAVPLIHTLRGAGYRLGPDP